MSLLSRLAVQAARAYGILSSGRSTNVSADYLVIAGGGAGGAQESGGGGGAGGYQTSTATLSTLNTYSITVGAGGAGQSNGAVKNNGSNSVISGTGLSTITSVGGGAGGSQSHGGNANSGGSGGGASVGGTPGSGTSGQGYSGGTYSGIYGVGAGGGGSSSAGVNATTNSGTNGGSGTASSISGSSVTYAGGGGGGSNGGTTGSGTGQAGGGNGGNNAGLSATSATANSGSGGGGAGYTSTATSGSGGSGIVIISYASATPKFVGGTLTTSGGNQIHTFTSSGTLSPLTPITASYLVVAGGGGGGYATYITNQGGGGGAGGLLTSSTTLYSGATYVVTVGAGGASAAGATTSGSNSVLSGTGLTTITSTGGGYGGDSRGGTAGSGGSGGGGTGAGTPGTGGTGTSGQGFAGGNGAGSPNYPGGGGGGAGAAGTAATTTVAGVGGVGVASSISGTSTYYAGGGGGGIAISGAGGAGGNGGGGQGGGVTGASPGASGTPNTGGGGGGGGNPSSTNQAGGSGGSGIVIISYAGSQVFNGGLVTSSGGNTIHTFTSTGALTPLTNNLNNSLRFRSSASAYLNRTPTVAGDRQKFTLSFWMKRGAITGDYYLYNASTDASNSFTVYLNSSNNQSLDYFVKVAGTNYSVYTSQVFRDPSAWYHIVLAVDTTQATAANRQKMYVNGNQVSNFGGASYVPQNSSLAVNNTVAQYICGPSSYFDGYLADYNFIDGQALEPYYFGNNDANGVWKPILYKGTYGTNGFYLTFGNTTSTTTLGYDSSPNGNNWTTNNISLTAGTTYDAMTDVPTNTSATVANYATINPLLSTSNVVLSEANLKAQVGSTGGVYRTAGGTFAVSSGKWYWELVFGNPTTGNPLAGVGDITVASSTWASDTSTNSNFWYVDGSNGNKINGTGGPGSSYGSSFTTSDTCMVALDMDNGKIWWGKNGTWFASGDPAAGTNAAYTNLASKLLTIALMGGCGSCGFSGNLYQLNFGQRPFSYTPPTGFVRLNTFNLPTPTILQGNKYMDATLWAGNSATGTVIVNQAQFKPDFVWVKNRTNSVGGFHNVFDSVRGVYKRLFTNDTQAEDTNSDTLQTFNSNGFTVGTNANVNASASNYVGWQWQAGQGSTSSNTSGSITSTVSVNTTAGFSVVTWTSNGSVATIGHGLGVAPKMMLIKSRSNGTANWVVYHSSVGNIGCLFLNTTDSTYTSANAWNNTTPSSTVFTTGASSFGWTNGTTWVGYCWAEIAGFSKFGSYTGNGSADGPMVYCNFAPKFILIKRTDTSGTSWVMYDSARSTYNVVDKLLLADSSGAEVTATSLDFLSNGFKLRSTDGSRNASGGTYIYAAFASNPFRNSNAY